MRVGGQRHAPSALPQGTTRYTLYRRLSGPQGRSGRVRKISSPPHRDSIPGTVQPLTSHYTDWAITVHYSIDTGTNINAYSKTREDSRE